jgi:hypothetical protein
MRLSLVAGILVAIALIWLASSIIGLPVTRALATLLAIPYGLLTAYLVWGRVRARRVEA